MKQEKVHAINYHYRTVKALCGHWHPERWVNVENRTSNSTNYCNTGLKDQKLRVTCKRCLKVKL